MKLGKLALWVIMTLVLGCGDKMLSKKPKNDFFDKYTLVGDTYVEKAYLNIIESPAFTTSGMTSIRDGIYTYINSSGQLIVKKRLYWDDGVIPIAFADNLSKVEIENFMSQCEAVGARAKVVCIERTSEPDYVLLINQDCVPDNSGIPGQGVGPYSGNPCTLSNSARGWSAIGRKTGRQFLMVSKSILENRKATSMIQHELLHAFGIDHEQKRLDRNEFVEIIEDSIRLKQRYNFLMTDGQGYETSGDYDLKSIMHYNSWSFGKWVAHPNPEIKEKVKKVTILRKGDKVIGIRKFRNAYREMPEDPIHSRASDVMSDGDHQILIDIYGARTPASQQPNGNELPLCQQMDSDSDGDGYGWENQASCKMP